jgi:hypothetical protein
MFHSIELCGIKKVDKYGKEYNKFPKLMELYFSLFDSLPNNLHNSLNDVLICLRCFGILKCKIDVCKENKEIKDLFMLSKARYKICIADACFSGSILNGESSQGSFNNMMQINDANIAVIMSSKPSQTSSEQSSLKQGLFSYFLIKGLLGGGDLNRDSYVTVGELFKYTLAKTKQQSGGSQIPVILGNNLDRIPLARIKRRKDE